MASPCALAIALMLVLTLVAASNVPAAPSRAPAEPAGAATPCPPAPGAQPLPMDLGPIPCAEFLNSMRRGRPPRLAGRLDDETRDSLRIRDQSGGLSAGRGQRQPAVDEKKESDWSENGQSRDSLLTGALGALPILKKVPLTSTPRGVGLALGKVHGMGLAVEMPRAAGRRNAPPGEPTVPVLSVNCRF